MKKSTSSAKQQAPPISAKDSGLTPTEQIDAKIAELGDWRGETLSRVRKCIHQADPDVVEQWKWRGVPVWSHDGILCTGEVYKKAVKLTFAKGASLEDPSGLFNASLDGNTRRAIDIHEGDKIDTQALKTLVRAAVALNTKGTGPRTQKKTAPAAKESGPVLLSGGNPQIAKADGDAPVQAYIAAMPGWKSDVGRRFDALITRVVPNVRKAVRWNSPFYGVEGQGWFLSYHCFTKYIKVTFLNGGSLDPLPPVESKHPDTRYYHIHEQDAFDEPRLTDWIRQASEIPGDPMF